MKIVARADQERGATIGGSEVAAVLGISKWTSPLDIYRRKTGEEVAVEESEAMRWGVLLEDTVAQEWARRTGKKVWKTTKTFVHDSLPISANIDRLVSDKSPIHKAGMRPGVELLEVKTSRSSAGWGESDSEEIPPYYEAQVQTYLGVTGCEVCHVAVLIGGSDFRKYAIKRDDETIAKIFGYVARWWEEHVVAKVPPPPRSVAEVASMFPVVEERSVVASREVEEFVAKLRDLREDIAGLKDKEEALKIAICEAIGGNDSLVTPSGELLATWRQTKPPMVLDKEALKAKLGDLTPYMKEGKPSRKFLLKRDECEE